MDFMKTFLRLTGIILCLLVWLHAELPLGEIPPVLNLDGKLGGRVDGTSWSSSEIKGKVWILFYADPDESELNNEASEAIKAMEFPKDKYGSIAIVNMAATWKPNFAINIILKKKQERYEDTIYVRDYKKTVVDKWGLADDSNDVVLFDQEGRVLFSRDGQLTPEEIKLVIKLIQDNLG